MRLHTSGSASRAARRSRPRGASNTGPVEELEFPTESAVEIFRCADLECAELLVERYAWGGLQLLSNTTMHLALGPEGTSYTLVKGHTEDSLDVVLLVGDGLGTLVPRTLVSDGPRSLASPSLEDSERRNALPESRTTVVVGPDGLARVLLGHAGGRPNLLISCHDVGCASWDQQPVGLSNFLDVAVDSTGRPLLLGSSERGATLVSCLDIACTSSESAVVDVPGEEWDQMQVVIDERDRPVLALQDHVMWCDAPRCGLP